MQVLPVDLTAIVAITLGMSVIIIPVLGLTARFALKPTVEALSRFLDGRGQDEALRIMERRLALVEQQVEGMETALRRVEEEADFSRRLRGGPHSATGEEGGSGLSPQRPGSR